MLFLFRNLASNHFSPVKCAFIVYVFYCKVIPKTVFNVLKTIVKDNLPRGRRMNGRMKVQRERKKKEK